MESLFSWNLDYLLWLLDSYKHLFIGGTSVLQMFGFYLLTTTFGRRWGIREATTVLSTLELCDVQ